MADHASVKRTLSRIALALITLNAVLAVAVLLTGEISMTGGQILLTSLLATATAHLVLAQLPGVGNGLTAPIGITAAVVGLFAASVAIWEFSVSWFGLQLIGTCYTIGLAGAATTLISILPLSGGARSVTIGTRASVKLAAAMVVLAIWADAGNRGYWHLFTILLVVAAAGALAIPILHRTQDSTPTVGFCPFCSSELEGSPEQRRIACPSCTQQFRVRAET